MESVAPKPRLAAELIRVADSARNFINELAAKTNLETDDKFPKQKLIDVAGTLTGLTAGSQDGALPALEYAEAALNDMRFSFMEIADGQSLPDFARGGRVDNSLGRLIADIGTAKRFYSQSKLDAAAKSDTPDHAVADSGADQREIAGRARTISQTGFELAKELDKSKAELAARHDPDLVVAENLSRKGWDVSNLTRQGGIEIGDDAPRIARMEKLDRGLVRALRGVELFSKVGAVAVQKIGDVLLKHVKDWFIGAAEWAEETRDVVATLKKKWQAEEDAAKPRRPSDPSPADFAIIHDAFKNGRGRGPDLIVIPAGQFLMGSAENEAKLKDDDRAFENEIVKDQGKRPMRIARRFALGCYPVTFEEYDAFLAATKGERKRRKGEATDSNRWGRGRRPVINVTWDDARAYCDWLNRSTGLGGAVGYRLPSEAEWEYACRAGTQTRRWWGDKWDPAKANGSSSFEGGRTSPVENYPANPWGLHDMIGNVWEWCADRYAENIAELPPDGVPYAEAQESEASFRVLRGGSWDYDPRGLRSAVRVRDLPGDRIIVVGFRVARTL